MIESTTRRVEAHTSPHVNQAIRRCLLCELREYETAGEQQISRRLHELDHEWDIERTLEANAAGVSLFGLMMGILGSRRWLLLPTVVAGFLLQHATEGWCPPLALFRRLGVRTQREIQMERDALRALRGDFEDLPVRDADGSVDLAATVEQIIERQDHGVGD